MKSKKTEFEQEKAIETAQAELSSVESGCDLSVDKIKAALKNPLYLVFCILFTISCGFSLVGGGFPVIQVLFAIFLWIVFAESKKGLLNHKNLKCISGIVYAQYVINNILAILVMVCGAVFSAAMAVVLLVPTLSNLLAEITDELNKIFLNLSIKFTGGLGIVCGLVVVAVGLVGLILNNLSIKKMHRFTKSIYKCTVNKASDFDTPNAVKNWLIIFGVGLVIFAMASIIANIILAIALLYEAASFIIAAILIDKYFMPHTQYV